MELYIKVVFWIGVWQIIIKIIQIDTYKWPRAINETLGWHIGETVYMLAFTIWAAIVLWAR